MEAQFGAEIVKVVGILIIGWSLGRLHECVKRDGWGPLWTDPVPLPPEHAWRNLRRTLIGCGISLVGAALLASNAHSDYTKLWTSFGGSFLIIVATAFSMARAWHNYKVANRQSYWH